MARKGITDASLKALKPKALRYEKSVERGLLLWVYPSGRKSWFMRYRVNGKLERMVLGEFGDGPSALTLHGARVELQAKRRQADLARQGHGPAPKRAASAARAERLAQRTVGDVFDLWLAAPRARRLPDGRKTAAPLREGTAAEYRRMFDKDCADLAQMKAAHVTDKHIRGVIDAVERRGRPVAASEMFKMLRALFRFALARGHIDADPMVRMAHTPAERAKERTLSDAEIKSLFDVLEDDQARVGAATRLALLWTLLTGCRPGEARGATWDEVDVRSGRWTIPGARTKNGRDHEVVLSSAALEVVEQARELRDGGPYLFPGSIEKSPLSEQALSRAILRLRDRLKTRGVVAPFTPHDLRRTASTIVAGKFGRFVASLVLGHVSETEAGVTAIYDRHDYRPQMALAWQALGEHVTAARKGKVPKVEGIRRPAGAGKRV